MGFIFASLYSLISWNINLKAVLILIFGAIPLDADHIVNDIAKGRIKNPRKMVARWFRNADKHTGEFHFLHNIEILLAIFLLALYSKIFIYLFISFLLHIVADYYIKVKQTKSFSIRDFSIILYALNRKSNQK